MANLFDELNWMEPIEDFDELIEEAASDDTSLIPYLKYIRRKVYLPKGKPSGRGNLCFLYSTSVDNSINMMSNTSTLIPRGYYPYYYYNLFYSGFINGKKYIYRLKEEQYEIYKKIASSPKLKGISPYPKKSLTYSGNDRNIFIDLSFYISIYNRMCSGFSPAKYIDKYCEFMSSVIKIYTDISRYTNKYMLIDVSQFTLTNNLKENLKNPLFFIFYILQRRYDLVEKYKLDLDIYFYVAGTKSILKVNLSKTNEKTYSLFKREMTKLLNDVKNISNISDSLDEDNIRKQEEIGNSAGEVIGNITAPSENDIKKDQSIMRQAGQKDIKIISSPAKKDIENKVATITTDIHDKINNTPLEIRINKDEKPIVTTLNKVVKAAINKPEEPKSNDIEDEENKPEDDEKKVDIVTSIIKDKTEEEINKDEELLAKIYKDIQNEKPPITFSSARDEMLRKEQEKIKVGNTTVKELREIQANNIPITENDISNVVGGINDSMKVVKYENFDKDYNEKLMKKDIVDAIMSLSEKSLPLYVLKIDITDTSDELNYKDTYTILFEDSNRKRHTVKVDIPKFLENKFMFLGGNKKSLKKQSFFYPVVKVNETTVHVSTNYNKIIIQRYERKGLSAVERFKKLLKKSEVIKSHCVFGTAMTDNKEYITTVEYDDLSKIMIEFKTPKTKIYFSQKIIAELIEKSNIKVPANYMMVGFFNNEPIFINHKTGFTDDSKCVIDYMISGLDENIQKEYASTKPPKITAYAHGKVMNKFMRIGILLAFWEGITSLLKKLKVEYRLENKLPKEFPSDEEYIAFKDCVLIYKASTPVSLILNGLSDLDTKSADLLDWDKRETYAPYIMKRFGAAQKENALNNFYEFMIDPITKEILKDLSLPEDIVSLIIYAVYLLADSQYISELDQGQSRIRSNEVIPAILYDSIAKNYVTYRNSNGRKKFYIPQNEIISKLLKLNTVENYSTLNPFLEMNVLHSASARGFRGTNLDDSYTPFKRSYHKSMIGTFGIESSPDGTVGVSKYLSVEPQVTNLRGYVATPKDNKTVDEYNDTNIFSPTEMCTPMCMSLDDATRSGHNVKQSSHIIGIKKAAPVLITNGFDEVARFHLSNDFVINAEEDGEIIDYNAKTNIYIAKYKSGKTQAIDLSPNIVKNSGGGFYLSNILKTDLKVGDKFKKNSVLAYNKDFFTNNKFNNCRLNIGTLAKVAIMSTYNTYQDGTFITEKLSEDAASEMVFLKSVVIGKNSNVEFIVQKGDHIQIGDSLIRFDTSYDDDSLNALLANMSGENKEALLENSRNNVKSKYSGVIEDVKIYAAVDLEEMSPTLKAIVQKYYKSIDDKKKFLEKYDPSSKNSIVKCGVLVDQSSKKVKPNQYGVIKGENVEDSVLIEIYIKHSESLEIGSKIACYAALKNTIDEIIEKGYEPYSDFRPEEEIGTIIASNSILKRMTPSIIYAALGNKCLIELKRAIKVMWDKNQSRNDIQNLIFRFFTAIDEHKYNITYYKDFFGSMNDAQFKSYIKALLSDDSAYLNLTVIDFKCPLTIEEIEAAAKVLNIPLYENVSMPHLTMDKNNVVVTREPVPVGYLLIKRTQQTVMKKNGMSTDITQRSTMTGQVVGKNKNGRESDVENSMLISMGLKNTMKELNSARADDLVMKQEMLKDISLNGYVNLADLPDEIENKTTLNMVDTYFTCMALKTDLVTTGLMNNKELRRNT